ncbi:MAG: NAD(P)/FAD-dependent oxidoreductase [Chitinophagaceae bacterium]|nr:MAG: NAD(P)/FAD-dependent oxidoreductase [Chitinophagaceae bacterium]
MKRTDTLIVGASISGLASAASLQKSGINYTIIERHDEIAYPWRHHYDRLHLHTNKRVSNLPYKNFSTDTPRYPTRQQVLLYLESYQKEFDIQTLFKTEAKSIKNEDDYWITHTSNGVFQSKYLIMATGAFGRPKTVLLNGMEAFPGSILHSSEYKTGKAFDGQKVLVVGFGNSACEIAIDLYEQGAVPSMSVRSAVNVIPRDIAGIPILELSQLMSHLPPRVADIISAPLMRLLFGDLTKLGLKKKPYGPFEQIREEGTIPVLDIGTVKHIRKGHIKIYGEIEQIERNTIYFSDGKQEDFDAIVACTGFDRGNTEILEVDKSRFEDLKNSVGKQKYFGKDGLYFCGFWVGPTGHIREITLDAQRIAKDISKKEGLAKGF